MAADWDPEQYARFAAERAQPFWDLVGLLDTSGPIERLVDLGCGPGDLTAELAARLGAREALGVDSSPAMLEKAAAHDGAHLSFELGDLATWHAPDGVDLVFANASLHWVPDHRRVLERWTASLRPGGQLGVQVPSNADATPYLIAAEVAEREPFATAMDGDVPPDVVAANVRPPEWYAQTLYDLGFAEQHVHLRVYDHLLPSTAAVAEWLKGTSLTRFFDVLPSELHEPLVDEFRAELLARLGDHSPYFFPFRRILMWGRLPTHTESRTSIR